MRPFTPFASYHDNTGRLLVGRVRFCDMDGHPTEVFDEDGVTTLGSSVFTDSSGRLVQQPFLADHDYLVFFDKYIGESNTMAEDDDAESWEEQGSAVDRYNTLGVSLTAVSMRTIGTIAELRTASALSEGEILTLMGYNSAGDKDPICYRWNPQSTEADNGGSVVAVSGTLLGRWELVECPRVLDVRHFGAFPGQSVEENTAQRYKIQSAGGYAHENGCGLYFHANGTNAYYDISGLHLYDVESHPEARVFCVSNIDGTSITGIKNIFCTEGTSCKGTISLEDEVVRTSWEGESTRVSFVPGRRVIVDSEIQRAYPTFEDVEVEILVHNQLTLDNCIIYSNGVISGTITIRNCELETSWFADGYDFVEDLRTESNVIRLQNCDTAQNYVILKNKQEEADYGDLGEQQIHDIDLLPGCVVENASFLHVILEGDSELHNVSGSCKVYGSCNWVDCWMELENDSYLPPQAYQGLVPKFVLNRGRLTAKAGSALPHVDNLIASYATIATQMVVQGSLKMDGCDVYNLITHRVIYSNTMVEESVTNCRFLQGETDGGKLSVIARTPNSVVKAVWVGNYSDVENPLTIDRTYLKADDGEHAYTYKGNSGTFIKDRITVRYTDIAIKKATTQDYYVTGEKQLLFYDSDFGFAPVENSLCLGRGQSSSIPWAEIEVFTVGSSFMKNVKATFMLAAASGDGNPSNWGLADPISVPVLLRAFNKEGFVANLFVGQQKKVFQFTSDLESAYKPTTANTGTIYVDYEVL